MQAVYLPRNLRKATGDPSAKSTSKNKTNRYSIKFVEHFVQPTEAQLNAIAEVLLALLNKPISFPVNKEFNGVTSSSQEVNS